MEPVNVVLHAHIEGRCDGALLLVAPDVELAVGAPIGQLMDQGGVAVEGEDDGLILGEQRVIVRVAETVGMLTGGLELH